MSMERMTKRNSDGKGCIPCHWKESAEAVDKGQERLAEIEDILGDTYDLDRLRELVEADKAGRCIVLPEVNKKAKSVFSDSLHDVFSEWSYSDPSVGINGMSDDERKLASAIMAALAKEEEQCDVK